MRFCDSDYILEVTGHKGSTAILKKLVYTVYSEGCVQTRVKCSRVDEISLKQLSRRHLSEDSELVRIAK